MAEELTTVNTDEIVPKREWVSRMRYSRSFLAKLILSEDRIKEYYAALTNALLAFEKTRVSKSRSGDGFYRGRAAYARLAISGKTLCLYLALDPASHQTGRYKLIDSSHKKKYAQVPSKFKVRSERALKFALKLIAETAENNGLVERKRPLEPVQASDYPFEPFESLLARDLIRIIQPRMPQQQPETPEEETSAPIEEPIVTGEIKTTPKKKEWVAKLRYSRSFLAKLIQSDKRIKEYYATIATKLLSYDKVKSRLNWSGISFTRGRATIAKITFAGKTLKVNLAADPALYQSGRYKMKDTSGTKKYAQVPAMIKVKSDGAVKFTLSVIDDIAGRLSMPLREPPMLPIQAKHFPYDTFDNLLTRGLIRLLVAKKKPPRYEEDGEDVPTGKGIPGEDGYPVSGAGEGEIAGPGEGKGTEEALGEGTKEGAGEGQGVGGDHGEGIGEGQATAEEQGKSAGIGEGETPAEGTGTDESPGTGEIPGEGTSEGQGEGAGEGTGTGEGPAEGTGEGPGAGEGEGEGGTAVVEKKYEYDEYGAMKISDDAYQDTLLTMDALIARHEEYATILDVLKNGTPKIRMSKKFMLKMIDETWVRAIEDSLQALDEVVRNPGHFIEETEELLPIERTKKVTSRSIQHLCQHTDLISSVEGDTIIPSKLLNVFREDSMMTYENKFINTLLNRLYSFVTRRYDAAVKHGANEKVTCLEFEDEFLHGTLMGRIHLSIELSGTYKNGNTVKNYAFNTDLWKRVKKLYEIARTYQGSEFVLSMGKSFIRPPVMRTNPILKNKYLRQCLALWEFIESYDDAGYGVIVDEQEENLSEEYIKQVYQGVAEQYLIYCRHMVEAKALETPENFVPPERLQFGEPEKVKPIFDFTPAAERKQEETAQETDEEIAFAIAVALAAEQILDERSEEERRKAEELRKEIEKEAEIVPITPTAETPAEESEPQATIEATVETPAAETSTEEESAEEEEESDEVEIVTDDGENIVKTVIRYKKSFLAKLKLLGDPLREYYCAVYNKLMSKNKVRVRVGGSGATFTAGRKQLAKATIAGKTLRLNLALDPNMVAQKYFAKDCSDVKKYAQVPTMVKIKSGRGLKNALELIDLVCADLTDATDPETIMPTDFGYETLDRLVAMGLATKEVFTVTIPKEQQTEEGTAPASAKPAKKAVFFKKADAKPAEPTEETTPVSVEDDDTLLPLTERQKKELKARIAESLEQPEKKEEPVEEVIQEPAQEEPLPPPPPPQEPIAEEPKVDLSDAGGDPLIAKEEAEEVTQGIILQLPEEEEEEPAPAPVELPKEEKVGGDALLPKPITLDALLYEEEIEELANNQETTPQPTGKKGLLSRLFKRKK